MSARQGPPGAMSLLQRIKAKVRLSVACWLSPRPGSLAVLGDSPCRARHLTRADLVPSLPTPSQTQTCTRIQAQAHTHTHTHTHKKYLHAHTYKHAYTRIFRIYMHADASLTTSQSLPLECSVKATGSQSRRRWSRPLFPPLAGPLRALSVRRYPLRRS